MSKPECQHWLGNLSAYIDGEVEETLCREIEQHMAECENCRVVVDTLRKTVLLYQDEPPAPLPAEVKQRLYTKLNLEDYLDQA